MSNNKSNDVRSRDDSHLRRIVTDARRAIRSEGIEDQPLDLKTIARKKRAALLDERLKRGEPLLLVLTKRGWQWVNDQLERLTDLRSEDLAEGLPLGMARLCPAPPAEYTLAEGPSALGLKIELPGGIARVSIRLTPGSSGTPTDDEWQLKCDLEEGSKLDHLAVGVGTRDTPPTRISNVRSGRPAVFDLAPAIGKIYRMVFIWTSADGSRQEHQLDLPLQQEEPSSP